MHQIAVRGARTGLLPSGSPGIDVLTAQIVIAEDGADLSSFPSEKQFTIWLGLSPTNEQIGDKILNRESEKWSVGPLWLFSTRPRSCVEVKVIDKFRELKSNRRRDLG